MRWIRRPGWVAPKDGTALAGLAALVALFPLALVAQDAGAATATSPDVTSTPRPP